MAAELQDNTPPTPERYLAAGHTPMMAQYLSVKDAYPDCLLFYRMGDFYELFFEDALTAAAALDITLTKRGKTDGAEIPMCGVPYHSYEPYLAKLIEAGFKVAICEQTETPDQAKARTKKAGLPASKALVNREVIRVVTPGTLTEDNLLEARSNNFLACIAEVNGETALAYAELSTGVFKVQTVKGTDLINALEGLNPSELIIAEDSSFLPAEFQKKATRQPASLFNFENAKSRLLEQFKVKSLDAFGNFSKAQIAAAGTLLGYIERTQITQIPHLSKPQKINQSGFLEIDAATRRNLELTTTLNGARKGSLLDCIDETLTAAGARLLQFWLSAPSTDLETIRSRHNRIELFFGDTPLRGTLQELLKTIPDIERATGRLTAGRGGPRDLIAIRAGLAGAEIIRANLQHHDEAKETLAPLIKNLKQIPDLAKFQDTLKAALQEDAPFLPRDGNFIDSEYHPRLKELRTLRDESKRLIAALQAKYQKDTKVERLKVAHNNVLGYFIEVPARHADAMLALKDNPQSPYIHRQTMANAVRFTTSELATLERDLSNAAEKALALELEIFAELCAQVSALSEYIAQTANALAALDVAASLAQIAIERDYTRPIIEDSQAFDIRAGRHPVVEQALRTSSENFIPNDCVLGYESIQREMSRKSELSRTGSVNVHDSTCEPEAQKDQTCRPFIEECKKLWLLTGPNMAGKSTFLRQNALIVILAQMGSFVPASHARIGIVDRVFSRVGASDDLAKGRSTFMVEMVETAAILNQATEKSLVILDEIGRGTATFDGLSIAWACVEHLHEINKCRGLFATHYHELTALAAKLENLSCHSMKVKEWKGDIIFLHEVGEGAADRSYGIHVAKLAGLPKAVISRAGEVLKLIEKGEQSGAVSKLADDLPLFTSAAPQEPDAQQNSKLAQEMQSIEPDNLTPREALDCLYRLKNLV